MKNKYIILTIAISLLLIMSNMVYAAQASITLTTSANQVIKGDTFKITISGTADNNIEAFQAGINFESEKLSLESRSLGKGFSDLSGDSEIAILATNNNELSKSGTLYTLTFKVLEDAEDGKTTISITNPEFALEGAETEKAETKNVTIEIKTDDTTVDKGDKEEEKEEDKNNKNDKDDKDDKNDKDDGKKDEEDDKKVTLPQTGVGIFCIVAIIIASICGIIFYNKYKKIDIS